MIKIKHSDKSTIAQDDLILTPVDRVKDGFVLDTSDSARVIAHSETGHHHVAVGDCDVYRNNNDMLRSFLVQRGKVTIEHKRSWDTHEPYCLLWDQPETGEVVWEIRRQREYTPEGWHRVED